MSPCHSSAISVFQEDDANHFCKVEDYPVQRKVHSLAVDAKMHCVYAPSTTHAVRLIARGGIIERSLSRSGRFILELKNCRIAASPRE